MPRITFLSNTPKQKSADRFRGHSGDPLAVRPRFVFWVCAWLWLARMSCVYRVSRYSVCAPVLVLVGASCHRLVYMLERVFDGCIVLLLSIPSSHHVYRAGSLWDGVEEVLLLSKHH